MENPTPHLVRVIKEVVAQVWQTGLTIVATISDQGATNQAAINILIQDTNSHCLQNNIENRYKGYLINQKEIVHIFDFPHLIKGIRNSLLEKNLHFIKDGVERKASWKHVIRAYEIDQYRGPYTQFLKLNDEHIVPSKIKKMRVKNCTQVFSHTVDCKMHVAATMGEELSINSQNYLEPAAKDAADLLLFFD